MSGRSSCPDLSECKRIRGLSFAARITLQLSRAPAATSSQGSSARRLQLELASAAVQAGYMGNTLNRRVTFFPMFPAAHSGGANGDISNKSKREHGGDSSGY